jgi:hypothetical protein
VHTLGRYSLSSGRFILLTDEQQALGAFYGRGSFTGFGVSINEYTNSSCISSPSLPLSSNLPSIGICPNLPYCHLISAVGGQGGVLQSTPTVYKRLRKSKEDFHHSGLLVCRISKANHFQRKSINEATLTLSS